MDIVTGATGCIGNVLVRKLLNTGKQVKAFIRSSSDVSCLTDCNIQKVIGDLLDLKSLVEAFNGVETVYHLASEITLLPGPNKKLQEINIKGTKNVIKACFECNIKKLVYTSSIHALKAIKNDSVIKESIPFDPFSPMGVYNRSKAIASIEVMKASEKGLNAVLLCPTAIIGPYDYRISHMGQLIIDYCNRKINCTIDGAYDFVDVRDVSIGHILASKRGIKGQYYLLSGHRVTLDELMLLLEDITGIPRPKYKIPVNLARIFASFTPLYYRITHIKPRFTLYSINTVQSNSNISHKKATDELGYNPRPIRETLIDSIKWYKQQKLIG